MPYWPSCLAVVDDLIVVGTEEGVVLAYDVEKEETQEFGGHAGRVGCLMGMNGGLLSGAGYQVFCWNVLS